MTTLDQMEAAIKDAIERTEVFRNGSERDFLEMVTNALDLIQSGYEARLEELEKEEEDP